MDILDAAKELHQKLIADGHKIQGTSVNSVKNVIYIDVTPGNSSSDFPTSFEGYLVLPRLVGILKFTYTVGPKDEP